MTGDAARQGPRALVERMRCPRCGAHFRFEDSSFIRCVDCGARYDCVDGIWRMLTPQQRARFAPFLESYPIQRSLEGWERNSAYHLSLPWVPRDDPTSRIWRIRRRSLSTLENQVSVHFGDTSRAWALDLGAGNCWLSRRLAGMGFSTVALDLNVEGTDSLSTGQLFIEHDKVWFDRVQGTMDRLPFGDCTFDLCTVSAALYYSDVPATLREVYRVLRPNGMFLISDSPVYSASAPGEIMAKEQRQRLSRVLGHEPAELPGGAGFLVRSEILEGLRATGFRTSILSSQHPLGRARRRIRALLPKQGREEAKFPVLVSIKPSS